MDLSDPFILAMVGAATGVCLIVLAMILLSYLLELISDIRDRATNPVWHSRRRK